HKRHADTSFFPAHSDCLRYIFKFALALVAQQPHAVAQAYREIGLAIIVRIPCGTAQSAARKMNARRLCYIFKSPVPQIVQQMACSTGRPAHEEKIRLAIVIKVEKARAGTCSDSDRIRS